jgi:hypothetical protein
MCRGYGKCIFTHRNAHNHLDKYMRQKLRAVGGDDAVLFADYFEKNSYLIETSFMHINLPKIGVYGILCGLMGVTKQPITIFMM